MSSTGRNIAIIQTIEFLLIKRGDYEVVCLPGLDLDPGERISQVA